MFADSLLAILHHLAILSLIMLLAAETALLHLASRQPLRLPVELLSKLDLGYGLSAMAVLAIGISRLMWGVKGVDFYLASPFFWVKMALFAATGLISIVPTLRFIRWRKALRGNTQSLPDSDEFHAMARLAWLQLGLVLAIAASAALMARGVGL